MIRLADYIVKFFEDRGYTHAFGVTGGGAMYLNDAFAQSKKLKFVPMHNEQSAAMAGEGRCSVDGRGLVSLTTGPGGTNAISGCAGAWIDSQPLVFISGQVESFSLASGKLRQFGVQEVEIVKIVKPITKYSSMVTNPDEIRFHLEKAFFEAFNNRKGPVWLDIPLDVQNALIRPSELIGYTPIPVDNRKVTMAGRKTRKILEALERASRPVILIGNGCREVKSLREVICKLGVPVITGWNGKDLIDHSSNIYMGSAGIFGNRAANFVVQNADLVIGVGYRFSVPQIGYDPSLFARDALVASVDIDGDEFSKNEFLIDICLKLDAEKFFNSVINHLRESDLSMTTPDRARWIAYCESLKQSYPIDELYNFNYGAVTHNGGVNPYWVMMQLSKYSSEDTYYVTDMGTSFTCTHQTLNLSEEQRLFTSSGLAAMGFGLPGAIGVSCGVSSPVVLVTGDGGFMFNMQELVTASRHAVNLKIVLLNNGGYLTMRHMQNNRFQRLIGEGPSTELDFVDYEAYASICSFDYLKVDASNANEIDWHAVLNKQGCIIVEILMDNDQPLIPRMQTISDSNGQLFPTALEDMFPHLDAESFKERMLVDILARPNVK